MQRVFALAIWTAAAAVSRGDSPPAVDDRLPSFEPAGALRGEMVIARAASTETLVNAWIAGFHGFQPGITVRQTAKGTDLPTTSLQQLLDGTVDLAPFVREIQPEELARARQRLGAEPLGIAVASGSYATPSNTHAIAIYVNAANPLARLTLPELEAIYSTTRRRGYPVNLTTWGQLGLEGEWAGRPIHFYGMIVNRKVGNPHAGIVAYLMQRLMLGGEFKPETRQVPDTGMGRGNNRALDEIVAAVAVDRDGIGYSGFANAAPGVKPVALAESAGGPFYAGTRDEVARRVYPLTRTIFVFVRPSVAGTPDPLPAEFLRYVLSRQGQQAVADDSAHFLPLPSPMAAEARARLR
jgi:phosphate transport system substrate-binding protein